MLLDAEACGVREASIDFFLAVGDAWPHAVVEERC